MHKLRREVLACYRSLHRTRKKVFEGDLYALQVAAQKIREEFRKHISEQDPKRIEELLIIGQDVDKLMKKTVVQLQLNAKGNYELKITKDTILVDNIPYKKSTTEEETRKT